MIDKHNIEEFLRANGVPPTAKDEEIRSMLLSARWDNNEVDTALMVLKQNTKSKQTHVDTLHKVFQSDDRLTPVEINSLLGINVKVNSDNVNNVIQKRVLIARFRLVLDIILALIFALAGILYIMYLNQAGPFYEPAKLTNVSPQTLHTNHH